MATSEPRPASLLGSSWSGSRWWYFPASALLKIPVTVFLAMAVGAVSVLRRPFARRRLAAVIGVPAAALALFLLVQPLDIGLRLALPVYGLLLVIAAAVVRLEVRRAVVVLALVVGGQTAAQLVAHPQSLAWTTPPWHEGYRWVTDGNLDIGQANEEVRTRFAGSDVTAASLTAPRGYEVLAGVPRVEDLDSTELLGDVLVSASVLTVSSRDELSWLRAYCPVEVIESAVLRYRFEAPVSVAPGPAVPASPCDGDVSIRG